MLNPRVEEGSLFQVGCEFCDEFTGGSSNSFYWRYCGCPKTRSLLSSEHFQVFPTIGQLVEGYLLFAPKRHYGTFAEIPSIYWAEILRTQERIRSELSDNYGSCVIYEHGAKGPGKGGCGIYHAHLHAMPLAPTLDPVDILKQRFSYTELADLTEVATRAAGLPSYLLYQDSTVRTYLFDTGALPSQYMRKLLAERLGEEDWDWRTAGKEGRLLGTIERLAGKFEAEGSVIR
jgi:diadenosine tetraphosphate (Ap4A) HIT family hydrolase